MPGINDVELYPHCILMYDDETVGEAIRALEKAGGQGWWRLIVNLEEGGYATAAFSDLAKQAPPGDAAFADMALRRLLGKTLVPVTLVVQQSAGTQAALQDRAAETGSQVAVIEDKGEFKGIIIANVTRSGGLFDSSLDQLKGQVAQLPARGLLSPRRMAALAARKKG